MERALVARAVTEESHADPVATFEHSGVGGSRRVRDAATHDAVASKYAHRRVCSVHLAATAATDTGSLAEHLGHHGLECHTLGQVVAMAAVRGDDLISRR